MDIQTTVQRPPKTMMEVYENLPEGTLAQLINNQIIMSPSPSFTHQKVCGTLFARIFNSLEKSQLGIVLSAPFDVYLDRKNAFQPDIIFITHEKMAMMKDNGFHGTPDLAIEVLSPSTAKYDLEDKMIVYAQKGVQEYWIVEPHEKRATGYWLVKDEYHPFANEVGVLSSKLLKKKFKF